MTSKCIDLYYIRSSRLKAQTALTGSNTCSAPLIIYFVVVVVIFGKMSAQTGYNVVKQQAECVQVHSVAPGLLDLLRVKHLRPRK